MKNEVVMKRKEDGFKTFKNFFRFFNGYFVLGIIIILVSIIVDVYYDGESMESTKSMIPLIPIIIEDFLRAIGIALVIGSVFDFSKNSEGFMTMVSNLLKEIIISKNFLKDLEVSESRKALEIILKPSGEQLEQCGEINHYFEKKINESMRMFNTNFKTNLTIQAIAKREGDIVVVDAVISYRIYKIGEKYFPITTTFERNNCDIGGTTIIHQDGSLPITEKLVGADKEDKEDTSPTHLKKYEFEIPEELYKYPHLGIKKEAREEGYDHWTNFHWNTLTPCDGVHFTLTCQNDLTIKEYFIFDDINLYCVDSSEDKKRITICSNCWLDENTGFIFTISDTKCS